MLEGLARGRHALLARTEDGRIALLDAVLVDPPAVTGPIELIAEPAVPVRLRYSGAAESCTVLVTHRGATLAYVLLRPEQTESFSAPAGRLEIRVEPEGGTPTRLERLVEAEEEVELVVD